MGSIGKKIMTVAVGLLLAAGIPYLATTAVHADPGCGCHAGKGHDGGCGHHGGCDGCEGCEGRCGKECGKNCAQKTSCACGHDEGCGCGRMASSGCDGCGCECGYPKDAGQAGAEHHGGTHDNMAKGPGGRHGMMHGGKDGPPMKDRMAKHLEGMREKIGKLRALEAKMEALKSKDDAAAFRAASLEHSKLLTDLQESHLKHMEGMMGGGR
ncbi:MAG TPA: hypothetical protein VN450_04045 [Candidatus Methylomirabilis sp.]|nr:hypothetical protein [Candidatus Methylomirabilis sp.]